MLVELATPGSFKNETRLITIKHLYTQIVMSKLFPLFLLFLFGYLAQLLGDSQE